MDRRGSRTIPWEVQRMIMHTDGEEQDLGRDEGKRSNRSQNKENISIIETKKNGVA